MKKNDRVKHKQNGRLGTIADVAAGGGKRRVYTINWDDGDVGKRVPPNNLTLVPLATGRHPASLAKKPRASSSTAASMEVEALNMDEGLDADHDDDDSSSDDDDEEDTPSPASAGAPAPPQAVMPPAPPAPPARPTPPARPGAAASLVAAGATAATATATPAAAAATGVPMTALATAGAAMAAAALAQPDTRTTGVHWPTGGVPCRPQKKGQKKSRLRRALPGVWGLRRGCVSTRLGEMHKIPLCRTSLGNSKNSILKCRFYRRGVVYIPKIYRYLTRAARAHH